MAKKWEARESMETAFESLSNEELAQVYGGYLPTLYEEPLLSVDALPSDPLRTLRRSRWPFGGE